MVYIKQLLQDRTLIGTAASDSVRTSNDPMDQYPNHPLQTIGGLVSGQLSLLRADPDQTANRCFGGIHGRPVPQSSGLASVNAIGSSAWDDPQSPTALG